MPDDSVYEAIESHFITPPVCPFQNGDGTQHHYCGDHLAAISSAYSPKGCGMEMNKNQKTDKLSFSQKSCCADALEIFQSTEDISIADDVKGLDLDFLSSPIQGIRKLAGLANNQKTQLYKSPPPLQRRLFNLYGSYVFYE